MLPLVFVVAALGAEPAPTITAFAGTGKQGFAGDGGPADKAQLDQPFDVAFDRAGNIAPGAGNGKGASAGDGGPGKDAQLLGPRAVALAPDGRLFVVERNGNCVRTIGFAKGTIERFAGTGKKGYTGDGGKALDA